MRLEGVVEGLVCPEWIEERNGQRELTVGKIQWVGWKYFQERLTDRGCYHWYEWGK